MTTAGYIRLYRALLEHPIFTQLTPAALKVWVACLLRANWKRSAWYNGAIQVEIPAGAFIFSQDSLARLCRVSRQQLRTALDNLQDLRCITIKSTNKYSLLVIENWDSYQSEASMGNQQKNQEVTSNLTTEEEYKKNTNTCASGDALFSVDQPPFECTEPGALFPVRARRQKSVDGLTGEQEQWFTSWWAQYWRHTAKKAARQAFRKHVRTEARFQQIMVATRAQRPEMLSRPEDKRPHGATWLNGARWEDEPAAVVQAQPAGDSYTTWNPEAVQNG